MNARILIAVVSAAVLAIPLLPAHAQTCQALGSFRLANGMSGGTGMSEARAGTNVWQSTVPYVISTSNTNSNALGCHSEAWASSTSAYGDLSFVAAGTANNCQGNGVFLWIDDWIGAAPKAQTNDLLTITSSTLPVNTPVQVRVSMAYYGGLQVIDQNPEMSQQARVQGAGTSPYSMTLSAPGQTSTIVPTHVGGTLSINSSISATMRARFIQSGALTTASLWCNLRLTTSYEVLTPGAIATNCSGAEYTACLADMDDGTGLGVRDGGIDINDLLFFLVTFEAGSLAGDLDDGSGNGTPDGGVDINDLLFFLIHFEAGC